MNYPARGKDAHKVSSSSCSPNRKFLIHDKSNVTTAYFIAEPIKCSREFVFFFFLLAVLKQLIFVHKPGTIWALLLQQWLCQSEIEPMETLEKYIFLSVRNFTSEEEEDIFLLSTPPIN